MEVIMEDKGVGGFQMTLVITKCLLRTIYPCNRITPVWDGLSSKFIYFSAGSLTLYKGL
jgi:hypothetical protein